MTKKKLCRVSNFGTRLDEEVDFVEESDQKLVLAQKFPGKQTKLQGTNHFNPRMTLSRVAFTLSTGTLPWHFEWSPPPTLYSLGMWEIYGEEV